MVVRGVAWLLVVAALLAFAFVPTPIRGVTLQERDEGCDSTISEFNNTDTINNEWTRPVNWVDMKLPTELSKVLILEENSVATIETADNIQVSRAKIGSQSKLVINSGAKLTLFVTEVDCYAVNWCSGHGECTGIDECRCEPGWGGNDCALSQNCIGGAPLTACGYCPEDNISCNCPNMLNQTTDYVDRLLVLETNRNLRAAIALTIAKLKAIKALNARYNPYSEILADDMVQWIRDIQTFADDSLAAIEDTNDAFEEQLDDVEPIPSACATTEDERELEQMLYPPRPSPPFPFGGW